MVNKFLYPRGGAETYFIKLGKYLVSQGHEVQYFGMKHAGRHVGNRIGAYTSEMDFHNGSMLSKIFYPVKTIYSLEAKRKIRLVLDDFHPDVVHLNNFNYQLTPSIILEIKKWSKETGKKCRIVYTSHDYQLVCPNHMCYNPNTLETCEKCIKHDYYNCVKEKCIHGSTARSLIGASESYFWRRKQVYQHIDTIICCSKFIKSKIDMDPELRDKTVTLHNFTDNIPWKESKKKDYVLYFGRYSIEKGIGTLLKACKDLPNIPFVFAGSGPLDSMIKNIPNVNNVSFQKGKSLEKLIREAKFCICPSECYENCPFSVIESQVYGTPVLGADIGGIPETINVGKTGELFESGNLQDLKQKINKLYYDNELLTRYIENCKNYKFMHIKDYYNKLISIYDGTH